MSSLGQAIIEMLISNECKPHVLDYFENNMNLMSVLGRRKVDLVKFLHRYFVQLLLYSKTFKNLATQNGFISTLSFCDYKAYLQLVFLITKNISHNRLISRMIYAMGLLEAKKQC
jgi:hypothetical protein